MASNTNSVRRALFVGMAGAGLLVGCAAKTPTVSFKTDVKPILDAACVECHRQGGDGSAASGLEMDTYEGLMRGTEFGRVVIPGDALTSVLTMLIEGRADPSITMPHGGEKLSQEQTDLIRNWVEQGAADN